ncbi:MAG: glycosyltransferase family 4 protein [Flavobacteriales bacterium]|nr:glycosyltransferase family 4 protein [Flavobacteriales bacterium]
MKLLILSQYFPPETGAPQNRLYELALRLMDKGIEVTILTAMPNYPKMEIFDEYKGKKYVVEEMDGMTVHRTSIYTAKGKGLVKRLRTYFSFVRSSYKAGKKLGDFDFIMSESPPLFIGLTSMRLAKKLNAKLIFNVSDLWPAAAIDLGLVTNKLFIKMAYKLEEKCYKKATLVTGQHQGIVNDILGRFPDRNVYWLPNGVDIDKYDPQKVQPHGFRAKYNLAKDDIILFYGGILGFAQGLEVIIKAAEKFKDNPKLKFVLMGSGPLKDDLMQLSKELGTENVIFAEPVGRNEISGVIKEVDASIVPLRNVPLFLGTIPSKIFEILSMEKPILLGVKGEAKDLFIKEGNAGLAFEPEDVDDLCKMIKVLVDNPEKFDELGKNGREYVSRKFNRDIIAADFYERLKIT